MKPWLGRLVLSALLLSCADLGGTEAGAQDLRSGSCTERMQAAIDLLRDSIASGRSSLEGVLDDFSLPGCRPGDRLQQFASELADLLEGRCDENPERGQRLNDIARVLEDVRRAFRAGGNPTDFGLMGEILRDRRFPDCGGFGQPITEDEAPDGRDLDFDNLNGLIERIRAFQPPLPCGQDAAAYGLSLRSVEGSSGFNLREDCVAEYVVELAAIVGERCALGARPGVNAGIEETLSDVRADIRYGFGAESDFERQLAQRLFDQLRGPCAEVLLATGADGFGPRDLDTLAPVIAAFRQLPGDGGWSLYWWFLPIGVLVLAAFLATVWALASTPPVEGKQSQLEADGVRRRRDRAGRERRVGAAWKRSHGGEQEVPRDGQPPRVGGARYGNGGFAEKVARATLKGELDPLRSDLNKLRDEFAGVQGAAGSLPQEVTAVRGLTDGLERRLDELADAINELRNAQRDTEKKASRALEGAQSKNALAPEAFRTAQVRSEQTILASSWDQFTMRRAPLVQSSAELATCGTGTAIRKLLDVFPLALSRLDDDLAKECHAVLRSLQRLEECISSLAHVQRIVAGTYPRESRSDPGREIFVLREAQLLLGLLNDLETEAFLTSFDAQTWCREEFINVADRILQLQQIRTRDDRNRLAPEAIEVLLEFLEQLGRLQWIEIWLGKSGLNRNIHDVVGTIEDRRFPDKTVHAVSRNGFVDLDAGDTWRRPEVVANLLE